MIRSNKRSTVLWGALLGALISGGCANTKEDAGTLADIDNGSRAPIAQKPRKQTATDNATQVQKSQEEVRRAYEQYVQNASTHDSSRQKALTRLAQLELELSNAMSETDPAASDAGASASLQRTITLLETTLRDYPNAKGNDKVLYQLAQAYDRAGRHADSLRTLQTLSQKYRQSEYYAEAQFRMGESAFARGDYITAEDAYTEVVLTPGSEKFYEKSLFKRGWTRYKQELFDEAIGDYADAMDFHRFGEAAQLSDAEKSQFNEYLRALALAFSYLPQQSISEYFRQRGGNFAFVYETYDTLADIYLQQERYSDAAEALEDYTRRNPTSRHTPLAEVAIIEAWKKGGFVSKLYAAIERFYNLYQPNAGFWKTTPDEQAYKLASDNLRGYITQVTSYFHARFRSHGKSADYNQAKIWYERYLNHYTAYANKDNIYALYGELLVDGKQTQQALQYFSFAAYDGEIILDKKSAYATIVLSAELLDKSSGAKEKQQWLDQHLMVAQRFVDLYPKDARSATIAASAAERAFAAQRYERAVELANVIPDNAGEKLRFNANNIRARAYLELAQFNDAESVYLELLDSRIGDKKLQQNIASSLALAIYRQAEQAREQQDINQALSHFTRIARIVPDTTLAATGWYDAIALAMQSERWNDAIGLIEDFKKRYPQSPQMGDVTKKLSVAYLKADDKGKAAQEFERIAQFEDNREVKMAALWQAAELYESKNNLEGAIRNYRDFANTYEQPYEQNVEAMFKLAALYGKQGDIQKRYFWQNKILRADKKATKRVKSDRTTFIASSTALDLARQKREEFGKRKLVEPLAQNLKLKKAAMQDAVKLFGQASAYGIQEITTEATHTIGDIYFDFSKALLNSERPRNLNAEELEQYNILLEDQAFPFEEKAIEFYEANMARTQEGLFDSAIASSLTQLKKLFPVRYTRKGKIDVIRP